ncbi:hypothetical protein DYL59_17765 [Pseudomonas kairouanensis]|uniref:Polyprenyl synthetase family protein n=1 Tax=Pseudomonas kairouanensis TaxID=2293832 RepID=A0A4Z0ALJ5_9PSED|nr:polyprenyl synthetase family protein [Pseudomonas kairouanensis]TFY87636.1 hypothetical protein DYL59_17765 [Pseudomonas kairouanensis]
MSIDLQSSAPAPVTITLLQLLEQDCLLSSQCVPGHTLPLCFWEKALLDPARTFFSAPGKSFRASLVDLGWRLAGGASPVPPELPIILEALHGGSLIVDDIEDYSTQRRGRPALYLTHGLPLALNTGNWLYFWALNLVHRLELPSGIEQQLSRRFSSTLLHCHSGQALDLSVRLTALRQEELPSIVAVVSGLKTGQLMGLATSLGAIAAGGSVALVDALTAYGQQLGKALQMLDDLSNLSDQVDIAKRYEDLRNNRPSWVWAWLAEDLSAAHFVRLQQRNSEVVSGAQPGPLAAAMLSHLGAGGVTRIDQCFDEGWRQLCDVVAPNKCIEALWQELVRLKAGYGRL